MHVSIGRYAVIDAATDEVIQAARYLVAALSRTPGFVSYALASISIFESRPELDAGDRLIGGWMAEHLPNLLSTLPRSEIGEIVVQRGM
jgi:hypothetical protein